MHPSTSQAVGPLFLESLQNAGSQNDRRAVENLRRIASAPSENAGSNEPLMSLIGIRTRFDRHESRNRKPAIDDLDFPSPAHLTQVA
jgi:hypothetical protein